MASYLCDSYFWNTLFSTSEPSPDFVQQMPKFFYFLTLAFQCVPQPADLAMQSLDRREGDAVGVDGGDAAVVGAEAEGGVEILERIRRRLNNHASWFPGVVGQENNRP